MEIKNSSTSSDLAKRILFTLSMLIVYRLGVHVPTPGVDSAAVMSFFAGHNSGIFGLFNTFSGGALSQFSVFALGIMPYISASIIFQLLTSAVPALESLKKEGEAGRKKINQYTRYATAALALFQAYGISSLLLHSNSPDGKALVIGTELGFLSFRVVTMITLTAGTCFIMWLGEQITEKGIGNGSSLIIFTGIASSIPGGAKALFSLWQSGEKSLMLVLLIVLVMLAVIVAVICLEVAQRRIPVQYSQKNSPVSGASMSHLPIKINFAGVIPPIFASSLLMFPATISQWVPWSWLKYLQDSLSPNGIIYNILFVILIVFFSFFYSEMVFPVSEISENLKKSGAFVPGVRSGSSTSEYLSKILERINVSGAIYLCIICTLPGLLIGLLNVPFYFGGTSLLILVGVALDTSQQIQSYNLNKKYSGLLAGGKVRSRRVQF